jgi:hypothetical protein
MVLGQINPCREIGREIRIPYRRLRAAPPWHFGDSGFRPSGGPDLISGDFRL